MRIYWIIAMFVGTMLSVVFTLESVTSRSARRQAGAFDENFSTVASEWAQHGVPSSERLITLFVDDSFDDDSDGGTGPSWTNAARTLMGRRIPAAGASHRFGIQAPGAVFDWRTQTLLWARNRDAQYDAIARSIAGVAKGGARIQVVARGRGADNMLSALRRTNVHPDRMLILGRSPAAGDEILAADIAFIYKTPEGAELAYRDARGMIVRRAGKSIASLVGIAGESVLLQVPFHTLLAERANTGAPERLGGVWQGLCGDGRFSMELLEAPTGPRVSANLLEGLGLSPERGAGLVAANTDRVALYFSDGGPLDFTVNARLTAAGTRLNGTLSGSRWIKSTETPARGGDCRLVKISGPTGAHERTIEGPAAAEGPPKVDAAKSKLPKIDEVPKQLSADVQKTLNQQKLLIEAERKIFQRDGKAFTAKATADQTDAEFDSLTIRRKKDIDSALEFNHKVAVAVARQNALLAAQRRIEKMVE